MKRFLMLVGVAAVAAAMYVAASPASQQASGPTARQFKALKAQVASLSKTVKGLKKVVTDCVQIAIPVNQFGDAQNQTEGYMYNQPSGAGQFLTTALDASDAADAGAAWFVGVLAPNRSACTTDLGENVLRHGATRAGTRHASSLGSLFTVRGH
jgi:hypothetical protein